MASFWVTTFSLDSHGKGEYLVAKLDALDYNAENGSITVQ